MIDELIKAAKGWRGMTRLVLHVVGKDDQLQEVAVNLGEARRRWKRVAATIMPIVDDVVGARGYNDASELIGSWDAPDDDDDDDEERVETDDQAAHRQHTQWCLRESAKMHEGVTRLTIELVSATIGIVSAMRNSVSTPASNASAPSEDEASKTLGMLLSAFMASQNNNNHRSDDAKAKTERQGGREGSDADRQGQPTEPDEANP